VNTTLRIMVSATALAAAGSGAVALAGAGAGGAGAAMGSKKNIEPQADRLLREMTDYLASLKSFKVRSSAVDEVVTAAGQKIQVPSESEVSIERPNRLRSEQLGAENGMGFWYDGQTMTLACKSNNTYARCPRLRTWTTPSTRRASSSKSRRPERICSTAIRTTS
jgi:hypothetical protein